MQLFPTGFCTAGFDIFPYPFFREDEYYDLMAEQWHIVQPDKMTYACETEAETYKKQYDAFMDYLKESLKKDLKSGKYQDYKIANARGELCGVADVGTIYFDSPEVGIILKEEYRGKGYGYEIMIEFAKRVKNCLGAKKLIWRTEQNNLAGICLALRLGGREAFWVDNFRCFEI